MALPTRLVVGHRIRKGSNLDGHNLQKMTYIVIKIQLPQSMVLPEGPPGWCTVIHDLCGTSKTCFDNTVYDVYYRQFDATTNQDFVFGASHTDKRRPA